MASTNLDSFIQLSRPRPEPVATSQEIRDRGSTFVATLYLASTPAEARSRINHVKHVLHSSHPASHEIAAWRCMVLKHGRTGLGGPDDFELSVGSIDDGEQWAGDKVLKVMQTHGTIDAVVVLSRWYGGVLLGPARFSHIETCASEVCQEFKRTEALRECISTLNTLDALLDELRSEYNNSAPPDTPQSDPKSSQSDSTIPTSTSKDYSNIDLQKGKRLIKARENAIKSVKLLLAKRRASASTSLAS